jgi:hypothetical protein
LNAWTDSIDSAYPPSAPFLSYLMTPLHPFLTPMLHLVLSFLLSHLATSYAQLVKDRMVLSAEVMREYDRRFVYKRVFGSRVDRGVGTHEGMQRSRIPRLELMHLSGDGLVELGLPARIRTYTI